MATPILAHPCRENRAAIKSETFKRAMPLEEFPIERQEEYERIAQLPSPPPKWKQFYYHGSTSRVMAEIPSRAWHEWHWFRGIDVGAGREPIPASLRRAVIERDGYLCGICGGDVEPSDVHLDHIFPWSRGGPTSLKNLRVTHSLCNIRKGAKVDGEDQDD